MVLFLHNRYRTTGGEERTVEDLRWLVREHLHEPAELLERDSASLCLDAGGRRAAARRTAARRRRAGGASRRRAGRARPQPAPDIRLARARRRARGRGARRAAPAPVSPRMRDRRLLHARSAVHALSRARHAPRRAPALSWQPARGRRLRRGAVAVAASPGRAGRRADRAERVRPRAAARARGAAAVGARPCPGAPAAGAVEAPRRRASASGGIAPPVSRTAPYALVVSRLAPEKGVDVAIAACRLAGLALVVAGDGPELSALRELAGDGDVRFVGRVDDAELAGLRAGRVGRARALALGRDVRDGRRGGDGRRAARRRQPRRRACGAARGDLAGGARRRSQPWPRRSRGCSPTRISPHGGASVSVGSALRMSSRPRWPASTKTRKMMPCSPARAPPGPMARRKLALWPRTHPLPPVAIPTHGPRRETIREHVLGRARAAKWARPPAR